MSEAPITMTLAARRSLFTGERIERFSDYLDACFRGIDWDSVVTALRDNKTAGYQFLLDDQLLVDLGVRDDVLRLAVSEKAAAEVARRFPFAPAVTHRAVVARDELRATWVVRITIRLESGPVGRESVAALPRPAGAIKGQPAGVEPATTPSRRRRIVFDE